MAKYSDKEAKTILGNARYWPTRTEKWGANPSTYWIRCQPDGPKGTSKKYPTLSLPGAKLFKTQPDAMWAYFHGLGCVDLIVVEVCGSMQNLNDKRVRYFPSGAGLVLKTPKGWFEEIVHVQRGGKPHRWKATGSFTADPGTDEKQVPVRFLRTLFVIPDERYPEWVGASVPSGHEFFMKHSSLKSGTAKNMQQFLSRMSFQSHFYTGR